jgi:hypothetical protein
MWPNAEIFLNSGAQIHLIGNQLDSGLQRADFL